MATDVSSPTRSRTENGPIGKLHPPRMAVSMSSRLATPCSSSRTALFKYGNSRWLTMNPAWSFTSTGSLPHAVANALASRMVSSLAVSGRTISTSAIIGAGLKKWMPHTNSGRLVSIASSIDRQRRRVRGEDRRRHDQAVQLAEEVLLGVEILDHALDHEVGAGEVAEVARRPHARRDGVAVGRRQLSLARPVWPASAPARRGWRRPSPDGGSGAPRRCRPGPPPRRSLRP